MMIVDGRALDTTAVLTVELTVMGSAEEGVSPYGSELLDEELDLLAEGDDSLLYANHCPLL